jgi:hypothetical protein
MGGRHDGFPVTLWDAGKREKIRSLDEDVNDLSLVAQTQIKEVLMDIGRQTQAGEGLRVGRALETLEWIGTPEARRLVETVAKSARSPWLRDTAAASLRRLAP